MMIYNENKNLGNAFESLIDRGCDYYRKQNIGCILKTPEPFRAIQRVKGGKVIGFYEKKAQPDYKGILYNGQCIIFEAKSTVKDRICQNVVTKVQTEILDEHAAYHAMCYVIVSIKGTHFFRIPWKIWKTMKAIYGRKYMTARDLEAFSIQERNGILLFLEGVFVPKIKESYICGRKSCGKKGNLCCGSCDERELCEGKCSYTQKNDCNYRLKNYEEEN